MEVKEKEDRWGFTVTFRHVSQNWAKRKSLPKIYFHYFHILVILETPALYNPYLNLLYEHSFPGTCWQTCKHTYIQTCTSMLVLQQSLFAHRHTRMKFVQAPVYRIQCRGCCLCRWGKELRGTINIDDDRETIVTKPASFRAEMDIYDLLVFLFLCFQNTCTSWDKQATN